MPSGVVYANVPVLPLLLLIGLAVSAEPQRPPAIDTQGPQPYQLSVNVDLVVLNAVVRDGKGRIATDLSEQNFQVYEDGVRQSIRLFRHEDIPVTVGLVVDHSGSMRPKLADVIAAARTFVQFSSPEDQMFVVNFNEKVTLGLPDNLPLSNRSEDLTSAIANAPTTGMTALYDAMVEARKRLRTGTPEKKVLIVISDGGDNASAHTLAEVVKMAEQSNVMVYTIGIFDAGDPDRNPNVLRRLAGVTGGEAFFPREHSDVVAICERIARDIRHQYTIGYHSTAAARPGAYLSIRVAAAAPGHGKLAVRARSGYMAGGELRTVKNDGAK
jgi:Ca-activated chloride channel family protein